MIEKIILKVISNEKFSFVLSIFFVVFVSVISIIISWCVLYFMVFLSIIIG